MHFVFSFLYPYLPYFYGWIPCNWTSQKICWTSRTTHSHYFQWSQKRTRWKKGRTRNESCYPVSYCWYIQRARTYSWDDCCGGTSYFYLSMYRWSCWRCYHDQFLWKLWSHLWYSHSSLWTTYCIQYLPTNQSM